MSEPFLAPKGIRDEFFLKLVKRIKKPEYTMHFMVDVKVARRCSTTSKVG